MAKQDSMFALVERWKRSGLSRAEFADEKGIAVSTFHYWCRRYDDHHSAPTPTFVEISDATASSSAASCEQMPARLRLEFPDGLTVTIY